MKKILVTITTILLIISLLGCQSIDPILPPDDQSVIDQYGFYNHQDDVALYIKIYHKLPSNFIKKGDVVGHISDYWTATNLMSIGGDIFYNRERLLPHSETRTYYEADINYFGEKNRNSQRIVFSDDLLIFYTKDHYNSFIQYQLELEIWI